MKKIKFMVVLLLMIMIPIVAKADMGAPSIKKYDVIVTNKNGTKLNTYDNEYIDTIPYDTMLTVYYEIKIDNVLYGQVEYNDKNGYINLADVRVYSDEAVTPTDDYYFQQEGELYVFREGAYLFKGPSSVYDKVDGENEVPIGTTLKYKFSTEEWAYVEYNGTKGWIYMYTYWGGFRYHCSVLHVDKFNALTNAELKLVKGINESDKEDEYTGEIIPKNAEFKVIYNYCVDAHECYYYAEYKDIKGWIIPPEYTVSVESYSYDDEPKLNPRIYFGENATICSDMSDWSYDKVGKSCTVVPKGAIGKELYGGSLNTGVSQMPMYVEYNGTKGWMMDIYSTTTERTSKYITKSVLNQYDQIDGIKMDGSIDIDTFINPVFVFGDWVYLEDENYNGWYTGEFTAYYDSDEEDIEEIEINEDNEDTKEETKNTKSKFPIPMKDLALYCSIGAVVLALVVIVVIALVNKKKRAKENLDTTEDNNEKKDVNN